MAAPQYNTKSAGVKRLMQEAKELSEPTEMFYAQPMEDNLFEWHFTVRGPLDSDFDGGIYHGKIQFPCDYPMKPPNMIILTPNGRFELNKKICLSISGFHPETWLPSWSIRTALLALIGFMPSDPMGALGSLQYPTPEKQRLAKLSLAWKCKDCGVCMKDVLKPLTDASKASNDEAKDLAAQLQFQDESTVKKAVAAAAPPVTSSTAPSEPAASQPSPSISTATADSPAPIAAAAPAADVFVPVRPAHPAHNDTCDMYMFLYVPCGIIFAGIFLLLLARRFTIHNQL